MFGKIYDLCQLLRRGHKKEVSAAEKMDVFLQKISQATAEQLFGDIQRMFRDISHMRITETCDFFEALDFISQCGDSRKIETAVSLLRNAAWRRMQHFLTDRFYEERGYDLSRIRRLVNEYGQQAAA